MKCESTTIVFADVYSDVGLQKTAQPVADPFDLWGQSVDRPWSTGSLPRSRFTEFTDASLDLPYGQPILRSREPGWLSSPDPRGQAVPWRAPSSVGCPVATF